MPSVIPRADASSSSVIPSADASSSAVASSTAATYSLATCGRVGLSSSSITEIDGAPACSRACAARTSTRVGFEGEGEAPLTRWGLLSKPKPTVLVDRGVSGGVAVGGPGSSPGSTGALAASAEGWLIPPPPLACASASCVSARRASSTLVASLSDVHARWQ